MLTNRMRTLMAVVLVMAGGAGVRARAAEGVKSFEVTGLDLGTISMTGASYSAERLGSGLNSRGEPLSIGGRVFKDGFWVRAHAYLTIELGGHGERFTAWVGMDDQVKGKDAAVEFRVMGDGRELWGSGLMKAGEEAKRAEADLRGVKRLVLSVLPFSKSYHDNLAIWAEGTIETDGHAPETVVAEKEADYLLTPPAGAAPKINAPRIYGATPGKPFLFLLPVSGERPMRFAAEGLPAGLTLEAESGIIRGEVERAGEYRVKVAAENAKGRDENVLRVVIGENIALTPPMGWNDWYSYRREVSDALMRDAARALVESGMSQYGYSYVNIDDCWMSVPGTEYGPLKDEALIPNREALESYVRAKRLTAGEFHPEFGVPRDEEGKINSNPRFPDMKGMTDYIHSLGLKAGIYTSPGPITCAGYIGSLGYEEQDAARFAEWGFDFLKYDWCSYRVVAKNQSREELMAPYIAMSEALRKQPRDFVFNLCQYGMGDVWEWGKKVGGHSWRTTADLGEPMNEHSLFSNLVSIGFSQSGMAQWAGPGSWNDPDYLLFGEAFGLSPTEEYSYMTLWSMLSAPLFYSGRMDQLDPFTLNLLCNAEVLEVNQDPLGRQATIVARDGYGYVWAKELEDGSRAVGLFNVGEFPATVKVRWEELGLNGTMRVRDLWRQKDLGEFEGEYEMELLRHGSGMVKVTTR